jgi:hypothetical protein
MTEKENGTAVLVGHPAADGLAGGAGVVDQPTKAEGESPPKIKFGSHEFSSVGELTAAYEKLERTLGEQGHRLGELRVAEAPKVRRQLDFKKLGDTIIENPEVGVKEIAGYVEDLVEERVSSMGSKLREESNVASREEQVWAKFFEDNPWLGHRRQEVQLVAYQVLWPEIKEKSMEDQFKTISKHFREGTERSAAILDGKELNPKAPTVASSNSPSGVGAVTPKPSSDDGKKKTFSDAVREHSYAPKASF